MRLIKMFGLAAVAAMAAMALGGATSASAADTQLCSTHDAATALTCDSAANTVSMTNLGTGFLLEGSGGFKVECDLINGTATPLALGSPQSIHVTALSFTSCETNEADGCTVTATELPLANLSKTGLDAGTFATTSGKVKVVCEDVLFWFDLDCEYDLTGLAVPAGAQHLTAKETAVKPIGGTLCPPQPKLDGLLTTTTANRYILS